jgi:hypothetical protein
LNNEFIDPGINSLFKVTPLLLYSAQFSRINNIAELCAALEFLIPEVDRHRLRVVVVDISAP